MDKADIIESYFAAWLLQDRSQYEVLFADNVVYSECYGPEYHGLAQITKWFDDWNARGKILKWDIKNVYQCGGICTVEWYFECDYDGSVGGFDGVSLIAFNPDNKIISVKEFQSKAEHFFPYD